MFFHCIIRSWCFRPRLTSSQHRSESFNYFAAHVLCKYIRDRQPSCQGTPEHSSPRESPSRAFLAPRLSLLTAPGAYPGPYLKSRQRLLTGTLCHTSQQPPSLGGYNPEEQATPAHRHSVPHEPATTFIRRLQPVSLKTRGLQYVI